MTLAPLVRLAVAGLLASAAPAPAQAPGAPTRVSVEHRLAMTRGMSLDDARRLAVEEALAEAVRRVVGTRVDALQQAITSEGGRLEERFLSVVQAGASGRVTDYKVRSERIEQDSTMRGQLLSFMTVAVDVEVQAESGVADAGFRVSLTLNRNEFVDRGTPRTSDEIVATVRTSQEAYITIFGVSDDTVQVLLPNPYAKQNAVAGGDSLLFPTPDQRRRIGLVVNAQVPAGRDKVTELYVVVATRRPVPFEGPKGTQQGGIATVRGTLSALNRWLVNIPLNERAVAFVAYDVRRQRTPQ